MPKLTVAHETWPLAGSFAISRGAKTTAEVLTVTLEDANGAVGRGECVPYARYGETVPAVMEALEGARSAIEAGIAREDVPGLITPYAGRNALDCALWDLEAKASGTPVWQLAGLAAPGPLETAYTLGIDTPEVMAEAALKHASRPLLKLKMGAADGRDAERLRAIRAAVPDMRLIIDANEAGRPKYCRGFWTCAPRSTWPWLSNPCRQTMTGCWRRSNVRSRCAPMNPLTTRPGWTKSLASTMW